MGEQCFPLYWLVERKFSMFKFDSKLFFQRVALPEIFFKFYRTYDYTMFWSPFRFKNGFVSYGSEKELDFFVSKFYAESRRNHLMVETTFVDFEGNSPLFKKKHSSWKYFNKPESFQNVLKEIIELKNNVSQDMKKNNLLEANGKRCNFIILNLSGYELNALNDSESLQKVLMKLLNSSKEHIYLFILSKNVTDLPSSLIKNFDWIVALGEENMKDIESIWNKHNLGLFDEERELIGMIYQFDEVVLTPIHSLRVNPSEYKKKYDEYVKSEESVYESILKALEKNS